MTQNLPEPDRRVDEIQATLRRNDRNRAIDLAITAFGQNLEHPLVLALVAEGLEEDGRLQDAAALRHRAMEVSPDDPLVLAEFARVLARLGRMQDALDVSRQALVIDPDCYPAHVIAGMACLRLNDVVGSQDHYGRAAQIDPEGAEALSALAVIASRQGDGVQARANAERALALRPDFVSARIALAQADVFDKEPAGAAAHLKVILARSDLDDDQRSEALAVYADALDALDRPTDAFGAYAAANAILLRKHADAIANEGRENRIDHARRVADYFEAAPSSRWQEPAGEDREGAGAVAGHVFLLGFPRSGTTLLEQVLASHPGVVALEEKPMLADAVEDLLASGEGLDRLASLSPAEADERRAIYWRGVRERFGESTTDKVFVDKMPLHTINLPAIVKLFPRAKIIFAQRDPRDVVLSCYRRRFRVNEAMFRFLILGDAAEYYHQTMRAAEIYRSKLPMDIHTLRHEAFVADFDNQSRALLDFIGVGWNPSIRNFAARARRESSTPSASQLAQGLSTAGLAQWRRYARHLAPVLPRLEPWVKHFGYEPAEPGLLPPPADARLPAVLDEISAAVRAQDWPRAFAAADRAHSSGLRHSLFNRLFGIRAQQQSRLGVAIAEFETAILDNPADFATLSALGLCLARNGRAAEGVARLDTAIAFEPKFAPAHYNRAWALETLGDVAGAREAYRQTIALDPRHAQALGNLAVLAGRAGDWANSRELAKRALALDPAQPAATTALAEAEANEGDLASAGRRLRGLVNAAGRVGDHERAVASSVLGDVLDAQHQFSEAFAAYHFANQMFEKLYARRVAETAGESAPDRVRRLAEFYAGRTPPPVTIPDRAWSDLQGHVFLVGFPRSGTTMLGQALAGHPEVVTLDERETLIDSVTRFMSSNEDLERLEGASPSELEPWRQLYWDRVRAAGANPAGKVFVDKLPMNTVALPVISKLFPDAKVLFLRRDPRDVVLSCFRRRFVVDPTTVEFLSLSRAAGFFAAVMRLMDVYASGLALDLRVQGYEALVEDFEGQAQSICDFLGLQWTPSLADFAGRASLVATPSSVQLARGLTAEGVGHWRAYADQLAPVLPELALWAQRFGYSPS